MDCKALGMGLLMPKGLYSRPDGSSNGPLDDLLIDTTAIQLVQEMRYHGIIYSASCLHSLLEHGLWFSTEGAVGDGRPFRVFLLPSLASSQPLLEQHFKKLQCIDVDHRRLQVFCLEASDEKR